MLNLPDQETNPDLYDLRQTCKSYIEDAISKNGNPDEDLIQYVFEEAMIALYGKSVFKLINELVQQHNEQ